MRMNGKCLLETSVTELLKSKTFDKKELKNKRLFVLDISTQSGFILYSCYLSEINDLIIYIYKCQILVGYPVYVYIYIL